MGRVRGREAQRRRGAQAAVTAGGPGRGVRQQRLRRLAAERRLIRRILFDRRRRQGYSAELGSRVSEAARSVGVADRVCACF